jgi:hypothetical protein
LLSTFAASLITLPLADAVAAPPAAEHTTVHAELVGPDVLAEFDACPTCSTDATSPDAAESASPDMLFADACPTCASANFFKPRA